MYKLFRKITLDMINDNNHLYDYYYNNLYMIKE